MIVLRRTLAALIAATALAGCGSVAAPELAVQPAPATSTAPATTAPTAPTAAPTVVHPPPAATPAPRPEVAAPAGTPWPAGDPATLQSAVDAGSQPWLLDATEVALSYAAAVNGWTDAEATRVDGTTVVVRNRQGETIRLTVAQPGRTGPGGIWRITAAVRT